METRVGYPAQTARYSVISHPVLWQRTSQEVCLIPAVPERLPFAFRLIKSSID